MSDYLPIIVTPDDAKNARLPDNYKAALKAIEQCEKIDECQDWADKYAALASYHRQANDREMYNSALRVQANAVRRIGDLLKILPKAPPGPKKIEVGAHPYSPRQQAIGDAGVSQHQAKTAIRVSNIPKDDFDRQINAANPPTVSALARQGTQSRPQPQNVELVDDDGIAARGKKIIAAVVDHLRIIPTTRDRVDFRRQLLADITDEILRLGGNGSA